MQNNRNDLQMAAAAELPTRLTQLEEQHIALDAKYWRLCHAANEAARAGLDDIAARLRLDRDRARETMKANERAQTEERRAAVGNDR